MYFSPPQFRSRTLLLRIFPHSRIVQVIQSLSRQIVQRLKFCTQRRPTYLSLQSQILHQRPIRLQRLIPTPRPTQQRRLTPTRQLRLILRRQLQYRQLQSRILTPQRKRIRQLRPRFRFQTLLQRISRHLRIVQATQSLLRLIAQQLKFFTQHRLISVFPRSQILHPQ